MLKFPGPPKGYSHVYLEDIDQPLPDSPNPKTRYIQLGTIACGRYLETAKPDLPFRFRAGTAWATS